MKQYLKKFGYEKLAETINESQKFDFEYIPGEIIECLFQENLKADSSHLFKERILEENNCISGNDFFRQMKKILTKN